MSETLEPFEVGPRIVGGEVCPFKTHPFVVVIFGNSVCGGSMLTLQWILTAAHCIHAELIKQNKTWLKRGFNEYEIGKIQVRRVSKAVQHSKFKREAIDNLNNPELRYDIGLVQAKKPFYTSKHLTIATLPPPGFAGNCTWGTVLGVGRAEFPKSDGVPKKKTHVKEVFGRPLMCVDLTIVNRDICSVTWPNSVLDDTIICTMEDSGGRDACIGDSGGPLVCQGIIIGVISAGKGCAMSRTAASYTSVEKYLDFIMKTVMETAEIGQTRSIEDKLYLDFDSCNKNSMNLIYLCLTTSFVVLALK